MPIKHFIIINLLLNNFLMQQLSTQIINLIIGIIMGSYKNHAEASFHLTKIYGNGNAGLPPNAKVNRTWAQHGS